jgi:hypothetical protein
MLSLAAGRGTACASATGLAGGSSGAFFVAVSLVMPPAPLKGESGAGDQFCNFSPAFGAFVYRVIGKLPAQFETVAAGIALVFVHGHWLNFLLNVLNIF